MKDHAIACSGLHQRTGQWRHPADVVAIQIDLVEADDAHHALRSRGVGVAHGRSEEDLRRRPPASRGFRVHDFRSIDPFREKANAPIDLAQPPFAVLIVGVLAAIAVAGRPGHDPCHRRPFPGEQKPMLVFESLQAARCDVVLDSGDLGARGLLSGVAVLVVPSPGSFVNALFLRPPFLGMTTPAIIADLLDSLESRLVCRLRPEWCLPGFSATG